jgi:hypothetical protein
MDSERFYLSLLDMLDDSRELSEVNALLKWWNRWVPFIELLSYVPRLTPSCRKIFPSVSPESIEVPIEGSALDRIRQKRAEQVVGADN